MKRKFVTNLILVLTLNLLVKPFWIFGIEISVQNTVGSADYGFYFSLFGFSLMLNILLDLGITNYNNRHIARDPKDLSAHFSGIVVLKFLLGIFYLLVCILAGLSIGYDQAQIKMLLLLILNQFLASFILYLRSNISGLHYFRTDSFLSILDRILASIFCGFLLWSRLVDAPFRIEWFVYSQTLAYLLTALTAFLIVWSRSGFFKPTVNLSLFKNILRSSYPFALLILLMAFYNRIDSVMLERLLPDGKAQAGYYAQSFRILDAAGMFAFLFAGLLLPIFSRMIKQEENISEILKLSFSLIMVPALTLFSLSLFYNGNIISLLYEDRPEVAARLFPLHMGGFLCISTIYIFGTLLTANGNLKQLNLLAFMAVVMNISLNALLIPSYKAFGAAVSSLATQFFMAMGQVILSAGMFKMKLNYTLIGRFILLSVLLIMVSFFSKQHIEDKLAGFLVPIAAGALFPFLIRWIRLRDLFRLIRDRTAEET